MIKFSSVLLAIAACALMFCVSLPAQGQFDDLEQEAKKTEKDPAEGMREQFQRAREKMIEDVAESRRKQAEDAEVLSSKMQAQYDQLLRDMAKQREQLRALVQGQWPEFRESTTKKWVDYNDRADSVSQVDFEKGQVEIEVLVPVADVTGGNQKIASVRDLDARAQDKLKALAETKLAEQTRKVVSEKDAQTTEVLKDQVKAPDGTPVTPANAEQFVKESLAPKMRIEDKPVVAQDGKPRLKVRVKIELVPDHLKIRAKRHEAQIVSVAQKYNLDPALVLAVIHTESEFNPRARSPAPAFGLMQLMVKTGAREAYQYVYKEEKILSPEYLYDPNNNILLGATYLHMLKSRHFAKIKDPDNQSTLMIAAYNCGPGCVRRTITSKNDVNAMSSEQLLSLVQRAAPKETQAYVPRVRGRMQAYRQL